MMHSCVVGLLMDWGSNKLNNIILPMSGKISVLAVNSFGCYVYVNISAEVNKSWKYFYLYNILLSKTIQL